jgi:hypothetical protein
MLIFASHLFSVPLIVTEKYVIQLDLMNEWTDSKGRGQMLYLGETIKQGLGLL